MNRRRLFIAIEGADGVGKTTIANLLCQRLGADYQKTPPRIFKWTANLIDKLHNPELEAIGYFILATITSLTISLRLQWQSVVADKYILTTIVAQTCLGGRLIKLLKKIRYNFIRKPDHTFCLVVNDYDELKRRLNNRGKLDANDEQMLPYWLNVQSSYTTFPEVIIIDVTHLSPHEILAIIMNYLKI